MKRLLLNILLVGSLFGCAGPKLTSYDVQLEQYRMMAVAECYRSRVPPQAFAADPRDQAILLMAEALANQNKPDSCAQIAGMNAHEARAKIAETQNQALGSGLSSVIKGATAIAGIVVAGDVMKESIKNSGDKTSITGDNNIGRDDLKTTTTTTTTHHGPGRGGPPSEGARK